MRTRLKATLARAYAATGRLHRLHAGRAVILTFHRVRPDQEPGAQRPMRNLEVAVTDFRRLLAAMCTDYQPLALRDLVACDRLPDRPSFVVTFDDGWADNFHHAFPVLQELGIPATVFLATGAVADRTPFWWQKPGLADDEIERLKRKPNARPVEPAATPPAARQAPAGDFLSWEQIRKMGRSGLIAFGPHGHRHELLTLLPREDALADIRHCWQLLKEHILEALVPVLSWPNGDARNDLSGELQSWGLRAAVGTRRGAVAAPAAGRWDLPRNNVDRNVAAHPDLLPWLLMRAR